MSDIRLETLLLDKIPGKDNISVKPRQQLYEHQIDGVRFIFKKWKTWRKKVEIKPSDYCVLNFPQKQGKSATALLFLYAIHAHIQYPILILCKDDDEIHEWILKVKKWTSFEEVDIAIDPTKALLSKKVFMKKYSDVSKLGPFCKRSWSVLVIKSDDYVCLPHFNHVEFTIWLTSTDITKNLSLLKSMHNWILPKDEFKMHTGPLPTWQNEILKHSQLESFVLIRTPSSLSKEPTPERKRIKNKDATGLKIKRSKKNIDNKIQVENNEKMDVETFVQNVEPIQSKDDDENLNKILEGNKEIHTELMDTTHGDINADNITVGGVDKNEGIDTKEMSGIEKPYIDVICTEINTLDRDGKETAELTDPIKNYSQNNKDEMANDDKHSELDIEDAHDNNNEFNISDKEYKESAFFETADSVNVQNDRDEERENQVNKKVLLDTEHTQESIREISTESKITEDNNDKVSLATSVKHNINYDSDLDTKLNEMQEKAMQKFKGSFLDSIF